MQHTLQLPVESASTTLQATTIKMPGLGSKAAAGVVGAAALAGATLWLLGLPAVVVLMAATISSVAGFAFSPLAGAFLFHISKDGLEAVQIMLVASIAIQAFSVWQLKKCITVRALVPYLLGGMATVPLGVYLVLHTPLWANTVTLGGFLMLYGGYMLWRAPLTLTRNSLTGQVLSGALGGITGATAAFPGAFVAIWCSWHGWEKEEQRAITQPYILFMQVAVLAMLLAVRPLGTFRPELLVFTLPALVGAWIGIGIYGKLNSAQFNKVVCVMLLFSGVLLSLKAM